jgi:hypothetical protein
VRRGRKCGRACGSNINGWWKLCYGAGEEFPRRKKKKKKKKKEKENRGEIGGTFGLGVWVYTYKKKKKKMGITMLTQIFQHIDVRFKSPSFHPRKPPIHT